MKRNRLIALILSVLGCICLIGFIAFYFKQTLPFQRAYIGSAQLMLVKNALLAREYSVALVHGDSDSQSIEAEALRNIQQLSKNIVPSSLYGEDSANQAIALFKDYTSVTFSSIKEASTNKQFDDQDAKTKIMDATTKLTTFLASINPHFETKNLNWYLVHFARYLVEASKVISSKDQTKIRKLLDGSLVLASVSSDYLADGFINHKAKIIPHYLFFAMAGLDE